MSLYKITYYRFKKEEMEGVDKHEENVDDSIVYLIHPGIFSTSAYEIDYYYTWENNAIGKIYKPGSKIEPDSPDMFTADTTLYTAWKKSNAGALILINEGVETDISDLLYGADIFYGKNQPFPYGEVEISKQMFNSDDYWISRNEMSVYLGENPPVTSKPLLIQGSTRVKIGVYGIEGEWEFQKVKDDGQKYSLVCVHPAHRLKDLKLDTLFEVKDYNEGGPSVKFPNIFGDTPFSLNSYTSITGPPKIWKITDFMGSGVTVYVEVGVPTSPTVSRIEGTHANIFKLLVHLGLGIDYSDMKVDAGTTYISQGYTFNTTYTTEEMSSLKANKAPIASNTNLSTTALRAQGNAWEALLSLGYMVNADIFFYDKAYFVDYQSPDTVVDKLHLNYGNEAVDGWVTEEVINIVENKDQGSQAIQTAQTVHSENYSTSISVSGGANTIIEGADVKCLIPDYISTFDVPSSKDNKIYQVKTIALNLLLKNYLPGDVISYSTSEIRRADVQYPEDFNIQSVTDKAVGTIAQVGTGYFSDYYIYVQNPDESKVWIEYKFNVTPQRKEKYSIYSFANEIHDAQNNLDLVDTKLALTHISYPSCITTYVWGNPEFLDAEQAMTDVEMGVADATISGTDDTQISDKYSAMMVYGNLGVSELPKDRDGFTGMILEKNWDKELYRFVGYKDGDPQAMFNTDGKIEAGGGDVILDDEGLTVYYDSTSEEFISKNALKFKRTTDGIDTFRLFVTRFYDNIAGLGLAGNITCPPVGDAYSEIRLFNRKYILEGLGGYKFLEKALKPYSGFPGSKGAGYDVYNANGGIQRSVSFNGTTAFTDMYTPSGTTFSPNETIGSDHWVVYTLGLGTQTVAPLHNERPWLVEFDIANYGSSNLEVYIEYYPYNISPNGIAEAYTTPTQYATSSSSKTLSFNLDRLIHGGLTQLSIHVKGYNVFGGSRYPPSFNISNLKQKSYDSLILPSTAGGSEVRISEGKVGLYGYLDGEFRLGTGAINSLKDYFKTINLYNISSTTYSANTWYKNDAIYPLFIMRSRASQWGNVYIAKLPGVDAELVSGHSDIFNGDGRHSISIIVPPQWYFRFTENYSSGMKFYLGV